MRFRIRLGRRAVQLGPPLVHIILPVMVGMVVLVVALIWYPPTTQELTYRVVEAGCDMQEHVPAAAQMNIVGRVVTFLKNYARQLGDLATGLVDSLAKEAHKLIVLTRVVQGAMMAVPYTSAARFVTQLQTAKAATYGINVGMKGATAGKIAIGAGISGASGEATFQIAKKGFTAGLEMLTNAVKDFIPEGEQVNLIIETKCKRQDIIRGVTPEQASEMIAQKIDECLTRGREEGGDRPRVCVHTLLLKTEKAAPSGEAPVADECTVTKYLIQNQLWAGACLGTGTAASGCYDWCRQAKSGKPDTPEPEDCECCDYTSRHIDDRRANTQCAACDPVNTGGMSPSQSCTSLLAAGSDRDYVLEKKLDNLRWDRTLCGDGRIEPPDVCSATLRYHPYNPLTGMDVVSVERIK